MSPIDSFWLGTFIFDSDRDLNVDDDGDGKKYSFCSYSFIKMFCLNVVFIKKFTSIYIASFIPIPILVLLLGVCVRMSRLDLELYELNIENID